MILLDCFEAGLLELAGVFFLVVGVINWLNRLKSAFSYF